MTTSNNQTTCNDGDGSFDDSFEPLMDDSPYDDPILGNTLHDYDDGDEEDDAVDPSFLNLVSDNNDRQEPDLYAVLGVARDASSTDIRVAYRRLSLLLHPDRHTGGPEGGPMTGDGRMAPMSADAEAAFGRISAAYAILNDPDKRAVYDTFGHAGLDIPGWELATCEKSAPELRLKYLLLKQKAEAEKQLQLTQPNSEFTLGLDMTDLFDRYLQEPADERTIAPRIAVSELALAQSVTAGVTMRNAVSLAGQVTAHNGLGIGTWMGMWRHYCGKRSLLSFTTVDTEVSYGRGGRGLCGGVRLRRAFGTRLVGNVGVSVAARSASRSRDGGYFLFPGFSTGWQVQLLPRTHARIDWRWNSDPGLNAELVWSSADDLYTTRFTALLSGLGRAGLAVRVERTVSWSWLNPPRGSGAAEGEQDGTSEDIPEWAKTDSDFKESEQSASESRHGRVFSSIDVNTQDLVEVSVGAQCSISQHSRLTGQLSFSIQRGVNVRLSMHRGSQTYTCSLLLSDQPDWVATSYGLVVPMFTFSAIRSLIYEPYLNRQLERAQRVRRGKLKDELLRRRREALATQALMRESAKRVRTAERAVSGLLIVRAIYGLLPRASNGSGPALDAGGPLSVDVTIPLQAIVERSHLRLPPGHWSDLQGFYDPCMGIVKTPPGVAALRQLHVVYTFHADAHEVIVTEQQGLAIPMTKHKITTN